MKTILFVEDESALQKTFGEMLKQEGYKVLSALDGESGLKLAKKEKPDLILLDLILPKLHGLDVLKEIKGNKKTEGIPVIVLTNLESMEKVDEALELGATSYLIKAHYGLKEVLKKVKEILG